MLDRNKTGIIKILVVEDELVIAEDLGFSLENLGYTVTGKVTTGEEALKAAEQLKPDLILMDIKLRGDIDGIDAADQIRNLLDIPVIYMTAYSEKNTLERAKKTEPYGYLGKPISLTELRYTIETAVYKHAADKRIRESELRRAKAEELAGLHTWEWDIQAGNLIWSAESYRAFGLNPGNFEVSFDSFINAVHKEDRKLVEIALKDALNGDRLYDIEFRIFQPDGSLRILHSRGEVERNSEGLPLRMLGMALDITDRRMAEEASKASEEKYRFLTDNMTDVIWTANTVPQLTYASPSINGLLGYTPEEFVKMSFAEFLTPESYQFAMSVFRERGKSGKANDNSPEIRTTIVECRHKDGHLVPVELVARSLYDQLGTFSGILGVSRDISERKKADEEMTAALKEKEALLREIHHRVKNNLAVIQSLLRIQSNHVKNPDFSQILEQTQDRIRSMALCHELLSSSHTLSEIKIGPYVSSLLIHLAGSYSTIGKRISMDTDVEEFGLSVDTVVPLGIILTELVSNSYRHAFPERQKGKIAVSLKRVPDNRLELVVKDDGIGLTEGIDFSRPRSMGYHLIQIFVKQVRGKLEILQQNGTEVRVCFPTI